MQIYITMTRAEEQEYLEKTKHDTPRYDMHRRIGDDYGRLGWTNYDVASDLATQARLPGLKCSCPKHWVRQVIVRPNVSFIQAILAIYKVQEPALWVADNILFFVDMATLDAFSGDADGIPTITDGLRTSRVVIDPFIGAAETLYIRGGLGSFRPDKYPGKTWTSIGRLSSSLSKADINIRSKLIGETLSKCKYYAGYQVCQSTSRGELYTKATSEVWSLDVLGRRWTVRESADEAGTSQTRGNVQLLEITENRKTPACTRWQSSTSSCAKGYRCNGQGTAITCDSYVASRQDRECVLRTELLNVYEHFSYDNLIPRKVMSVSSTSGKVWTLNSTLDQVVLRTLDPLAIQVAKLEYDQINGLLLRQVTSLRHCVFADAECEHYDESAPGGCSVGTTPCKHFIGGFCGIGLSCNDQGRLATCPQYTGGHRTCKAHSQGALIHHYLYGCPDTTVRWRKLTPDSSTDITTSSILRTNLLGRGDPTNVIDTNITGRAALDPECLVYQEIVTHLQIDGNTYRRKHHLSQLDRFGRMVHTTREYNVPSAQMPSHPIVKRKMTVFGEVDPVVPPATSRPRYELDDSNIVDWDDAQHLAQRTHDHLSEVAVQDEYTVPGELLLERGTPITLPGEGEETYLLSGVSGVGVVLSTEVKTVVSPDGSGLSSSVVQVRK